MTIQAQILDLMVGLNRDFGTAIILITHDLGVVAEVCQRVIVMYAGKIVEEGSAEDLFDNPQHPYTLGLLRSVPRIGDNVKEELVPIGGLAAGSACTAEGLPVPAALPAPPGEVRGDRRRWWRPRRGNWPPAGSRPGRAARMRAKYAQHDEVVGDRIGSSAQVGLMATRRHGAEANRRGRRRRCRSSTSRT